MGLTSSGLKILAPAIAASKLKSLDISENTVGGEAISVLCTELSTNKTMTELNASSLFNYFFFSCLDHFILLVLL